MNKLNKIHLIIILGLSILSLVSIVGYYGLKNDVFYQYETVPHLDLGYSIGYDEVSNIYYGDIKGFVAFDDINNQPKNFEQYYIITPLNEMDGNNNTYYSLEEILVMDYLPPSTINSTVLSEINNTAGKITLSDQEGNMFIVDQNNKSVSILDSTDDKAHLIIDNNEYKDLKVKLYK